ncbi:hypothetical protein [Marinifilum sp.]|uniref:hypothetical protein n=1 Tax=Marinifilum sp. TaxID=2033137 RepID=UPI003BAD35BF
MRIIFCILLLYNINYYSFGQTVLIDTDTHSPILFAHVVSENGNLLATSDLNGIIEIDADNSAQCDSLIVQHISYKSIKISYEDLNANDSVFMIKNTHILAESIVMSSKPEIIVLKGYYRSYELDDNIPKYFTDGIVEYYIPVKNEKKIKMRIIENRSYCNNVLVQAEKKRTNMIVMRLAGIPRIVHGSILKTLSKKNYKVRDISKNIIEITKDSSVVGIVERNFGDSTVLLNLDFIAPKKHETRTLFNYTSQITSNELTEIYPNIKLSLLSTKDILRRKKHRLILFKHKKDNKSVKLEGIDELYIFNRSYISKEEFKLIKSSSYAFPESTSYTNEYWKNLGQYDIPYINANIENLIGKILNECK